MKSEAYLSEIRKAEHLQRAVLKKIVIEGRTATFYLITDLTYTGGDIAYAESVSARYVPEGFGAKVNLTKSVPSAEGVRAAISAFLKEKFPAAAAFISPADIEVVTGASGGRYSLSVSEDERRQFSRGDVLDALGAELKRRFCGVWTGGFREVERPEGEIEREEIPPEEFLTAPRSFEITGYTAIDGAAPSSARYIADLAGEQTVTLCGRVTYIEERRTKNDKPYFSVSITDGSGQLRASYFSKKATLEKVRAIRQGDSVCLTGVNELFNGAYRFTAKQIDLGSPPEGFTPVPRPSRPVPARYSAVRPEPAADYVQADFFGAKPLPGDFCRETFVVFDLETTGLNYLPAHGAMDRIIEIGAVKIAGGQITEKFSTFVACPVRLPAEIVDLTGIDDKMLAGAPEIGEVIADFFKFCSGCVLVGHNVQFDFGFIHYYGGQEGYQFENRTLDTVALAQAGLSLPNYKLNTVADHFGFEFHHHRAYDDAFVTAKIFMELIRNAGGLPAA